MNALKPVLVGLTGVGALFFGFSFLVDALEPARWYFALLGVAALSMIPDNRVIRAAFGTAVLASLVFFITQLLSKTSLATKNIDLTEYDRYTLTEGTLVGPWETELGACLALVTGLRPAPTFEELRSTSEAVLQLGPFFRGFIDEVRISAEVRDVNWRLLQNELLNENVVTLGSAVSCD